MSWIKSNLQFVAAIAIGIVLIGLSAAFAIHEWRVAQTAKTQTRLSKGQADAAINSGGDAVNTIGNRMDADRQGDQTVEETKNAINNASDASGVDAAGHDGLCRLAAYRGRPECVRHPDP